MIFSLMFRRVDSIRRLLSQHQPRYVENSTCQLKKNFSFLKFFCQFCRCESFSAAEKFRHGQRQPWATSYTLQKSVGPMSDVWKGIRVFKPSRQKTKFQKFSAKKRDGRGFSSNSIGKIFVLSWHLGLQNN